MNSRWKGVHVHAGQFVRLVVRTEVAIHTARSALPSELCVESREAKGGGSGSNLQPRRVPSETGHRKNKEPEPPGTTQVTRGPWRSNPPSESQSRCIWLETYHSALPASDRGGWSRAAFPG